MRLRGILSVHAAIGANRCLQFQKRGQYFIGSHDETLSVAMRGNNPDCAPFAING